MRIETKLRGVCLLFALGPLFFIIWQAMQTPLRNDTFFNQVLALAFVAAIFFALIGPWFAKRWLFYRQIEDVERFCLAVKEGRYDISLPVPNEACDKEDENELISLMRDLNWMAHRIGRREQELQRSLCDLAESHREIHEKTISLEDANSSLLQVQEQLKAQKAELEQAFVEMRHLAMTDALTEISNRRYFFECLSRELLEADKDTQPLSLLMLDIDHFKKINDRFGHQGGDVVLRELARRLQHCIRRSDILARIGGEEFAIVLPNTDCCSAFGIAQRIYTTINQQPFQLYSQQGTTVTVSIGLCSLVRSTYPAMDDFFRYADAALYHCKQCGRNGICRYDPTSHKIGKLSTLS